MKILLIWDYYENYLKYFYTKNPQAPDLPYDEHKQLLLNDFFMWPTYLIPHLQTLGHEADVIIGNALPLQKTWLGENGLESQQDFDRFAVIQAQVRVFRPDILLVLGADCYTGSFAESLKDCCRRIVAWRAAGILPHQKWSGIDCVLSSHSNFVDQFRQMGLASERLLPCFEPRILDYLPPTSITREVGFAGTLSTIGFSQRLSFLSYVQQMAPLHIYAENIIWRRRFWPIRTFLSQHRFVRFWLNANLHPAVYGIDMFNTLRQHRLILNIHVDSAGGLAGNIRMFESTGVGVPLVTENAINLSELFEPGREVIAYDNQYDAVEKIKYYLSHEQKCKAIALAGQKRTLRAHNSYERSREIEGIFQRWLSTTFN